MRISSKGEYGLRALFDLTLHYGEGPIQSRDIHRRQGIDENYLNQILILLRKAGIIESLRGSQGGHRLARAPDQITLLDVLIALEGPILPEDSSRDEQAMQEAIDREIMRDVWCRLRQTIEQYLANTTLDDLSQRKRERIGEVMYYI